MNEVEKKILSFYELCLDIKMHELEECLNDPQTQWGLELSKLTDPQAYYETMQRIEDARKSYEQTKQLVMEYYI